MRWRRFEHLVGSVGGKPALPFVGIHLTHDSTERPACPVLGATLAPLDAIPSGFLPTCVRCLDIAEGILNG